MGWDNKKKNLDIKKFEGDIFETFEMLTWCHMKKRKLLNII